MHEHPVYVTGMMESGKSTLLSLMDGHPELLVFPQEPQFGRMLEQHFASADAARHWCLEESPFGKHGRLLGIEDRQSAVFDHGKYRAALTAALDHGFAAREVMLATLQAFAAATGQTFEARRHWVFNEPNRARLAPWFFSVFPHGRVIHLIRDPRDHLRAVQAHHRQAEMSMGRRPALNFSMDWALGATQALENRSRFGAARYLVLRFEDVREQRQDAMQRVARFLEVADDPAFSTPSKVGIAARAPGERIAESQIGDWMQPLSARERLVVEACCGELMNQTDLNYPTTTSHGVRRLLRGLLSRATAARYYGKRLTAGLIAPVALHEIHRIDKATSNSYAFRL